MKSVDVRSQLAIRSFPAKRRQRRGRGGVLLFEFLQTLALLLDHGRGGSLDKVLVG